MTRRSWRGLHQEDSSCSQVATLAPNPSCLRRYRQRKQERGLEASLPDPRSPFPALQDIHPAPPSGVTYPENLPRRPSFSVSSPGLGLLQPATEVSMLTELQYSASSITIVKDAPPTTDPLLQGSVLKPQEKNSSNSTEAAREE